MDKQRRIQVVSYLQARCRGFLVRKDLKSVQAEFEEIVKEIDGCLDHMYWSGDVIPIPRFTDTSELYGYSLPKVQSQHGIDSPDKSKVEEEEEEEDGETETSPSHTEVFVPEKDEESSHSLKRDCRPTSTPPEGEGEEEVVMKSLSNLEMNYNNVLQHGHQIRSVDTDVARTPEDLRQHRKALAMELLWIQQAIASRKKYLALKEKMEMT